MIFFLEKENGKTNLSRGLWVIFLMFRSFVEACGAHNDFGHFVWIAVGRRSAVFQVAFLFFGTSTWNTDAGTTVGYACVKKKIFCLCSLISFVGSWGVVRIESGQWLSKKKVQPLSKKNHTTNWLFNISFFTSGISGFRRVATIIINCILYMSQAI